MRVVGLVIFLLRTFMASTDRSKRKIWQSYTMFYADYVVNCMIALMLGLIYCTIQPIILPMCLVYFLIANVIWRYNLLYVFREEYQSGGLLWPLLHDQVLVIKLKNYTLCDVYIYLSFCIVTSKPII